MFFKKAVNLIAVLYVFFAIPMIGLSQYDYKPTLSEGQVIPDTGDRHTEYEYYVRFIDMDGGYTPVSRIYINDVKKTMEILTETSTDRWFKLTVQGNELNIGDNDFYFFFVDDEGNSVRLPETSAFGGPFVNPDPFITPTLTPTPSVTSTPRETLTPTATPSITTTPLLTPVPTERLWITIPRDFYYNTILLSWHYIPEADHYILELDHHGEIFPFEIHETWLRLIVDNREDWRWFVDYGSITFRVSAVDADGNIIEGPTDWFSFVCK